MPLVYDPTDVSLRADPYPLYARLRAEDPVHWSPHLKGWLVTRYEDVQRVGRDGELSVDKFTPFYRSLPAETRPKVEDLIHYLSRWLVFRDPPDHTRLRLLLQRAFTPKAMEALRPSVEGVVEHLLEGLPAGETVDLVERFTVLLPAYVIMDMLGVPRVRLAEMKAWSDEMQLFVGSAQGIPDKYERARHGMVSMAALFRELVAERRREPRDDVLTRLVHARDETAGSGAKGVLDDEELVASCILFLFAGHETTTHLLGSAALQMSADPAVGRRLAEEPAIVASAVEEFLRYEGPINAFARVALVEHRLGERTIEPGQRVFAMVGAANRDPAEFAEPDRLDLARTPNRHVTFGYGLHFCLGAPLARMEAQIALPRLAARFPEMRLAGEPPRWIDSMIMRGIGALPVHLGNRR